MTTTTLALLDAVRAHLREFEVPDPCSVQATAHGPDLTVQLASNSIPAIAEALLAWSDTLTHPAAEAWRVPEGGRVHLSVRGGLPGGVPLRVYGGVPFLKHGPGGGLAPGQRATMPLGALRHLADLGQVPTP